MMRTVFTLVWFVACAIALAHCGPAWAQAGFDRPGGDYTNFVVRNGDPEACSDRCDHDARCKSWSFSYPTPRGHRAICWLKSDVPARVENTCCVSGVRGGGIIEPRSADSEFGIDRFGGDYRNFEPAADSNGESCASACKAEARCRAWTYVRPGYYGAAPRCYLKARVTPPRRRPCCVSGVVR
jgi:PAN domain